MHRKLASRCRHRGRHVRENYHLETNCEGVKTLEPEKSNENLRE